MPVIGGMGRLLAGRHSLRLVCLLLLLIPTSALVACGDITPSPPAAARPTLPADAAQLVAEARAALDAGDPAQAIAKLLAVLERNPDSVEAHYLLGNAFAQHEQLPEGEEQYQIVLRSDPGHTDAHSNLGVVYYRQGKLDEAEKAIRMAVQQKGNDAEIRYNLGGVLAAQGKLDEAVREFLRARELAPSLAQPYLGLGSVYQQQGKRDEAIAALKEYVRRSDDAQWRAVAEKMLREIGAQP